MLLILISGIFLIISLFSLFKDFKSLNRDISLRLQLKRNILKDLREEKKDLQKNLEGYDKKINSFHMLFDHLSNLIRSLEERDIIENFKKALNKFAQFSDALLLKKRDISGGYTLFPLEKGSGYYFIGLRDLKIQEPYFLNLLVRQLSFCLKRSRLYKTAEELAMYDFLTAVFSRRHLLERLEDEFGRSSQYNLRFSVIMVDIDHFKKCNDTYGHLVGDVVLKEVAEVLKENIRSIDFVGRYGGEEFLVVLPETDRDNALGVGQRILGAMRNKEIHAYDERLEVRVSMGLASYPENGKNTLEIIDASDRALYRAKRKGRDRICLAQ